MKTQKMNLKNIKNHLSRDEMKKVMAGSGPGGGGGGPAYVFCQDCCGGAGWWCVYSPDFNCCGMCPC